MSALCLSGILLLAACSERSEYDLTEYELKPGQYKIEGAHRVVYFPDGKPSKIIEDFPLDIYGCVTAENNSRVSKAEFISAMMADGQEVLEVKVEPFRDYAKVTSLPNAQFSNLMSLTTIDYRSDLLGATTTIEGTTELADGTISLAIWFTSLWVGADCTEDAIKASQPFGG